MLGATPSSLLFGYTPRLYRGAPSVELIVDECWEEHFLRVESDLARASVNLDKRNKELVIRFNRFRGNSDFSLGDMVHVDTSNLPSPTPYAFRKRYVGPFPVIKKCGANSFRLALPEHWNVHDVFHKRMLRHSLTIMQGDVEVDGEGEAVYSFPLEEGDAEARKASEGELSGLGGQHSGEEPKEPGESAEEASEEESRVSEDPEGEEGPPQVRRRKKYLPPPYSSISSRTRSRLV